MTVVNYRVKTLYYCSVAFLLSGIVSMVYYFNRQTLPVLILTIGFVSYLLYIKCSCIIIALRIQKTIRFDDIDNLLYFKRFTKNKFSFVQDRKTIEVPYEHFSTHDKDYILYNVRTNSLFIPMDLKYTILDF